LKKQESKNEALVQRIKTLKERYRSGQSFQEDDFPESPDEAQSAPRKKPASIPVSINRQPSEAEEYDIDLGQIAGGFTNYNNQQYAAQHQLDYTENGEFASPDTLNRRLKPLGDVQFKKKIFKARKRAQNQTEDYLEELLDQSK
jgi:hypothetical protein